MEALPRCEGLIRSHLERLYTIAPFWEQLAMRIRRLYRWEEPKTTAAAAMIYFVLWYTQHDPDGLHPDEHVLHHAIQVLPSSESYLHEKVKIRMARGQGANTLSEKLRRRSRLESSTFINAGSSPLVRRRKKRWALVADFHEKVKNLILCAKSGGESADDDPLWSAEPLCHVYTLAIHFQRPSSSSWGSPSSACTSCRATSHHIAKHYHRSGGARSERLPTRSSPSNFAQASFGCRQIRRAAQTPPTTSGELSSSSKSNAKLKPRPDRREEGIAYDQIEDPSRASVDYVEMSKDSTLKPPSSAASSASKRSSSRSLHVNTKYLYFTPLHSPSQKRGVRRLRRSSRSSRRRVSG